jgi:hypothetical protein
LPEPSSRQSPPPLKKSADLPMVSPILLSRYQRETLYNEVWLRPAIEVAKKYGVSDVALGKTCKKLLIPVPGRGYWEKLRAGKPVPQRPALPPVTVMR